jgi:DNA invertase Pin-like site-specific DNA recombinase
MREYLPGKNQRRAVGPQTTCEAHGGSRKGDVLVVTRLDRLARSTRDLLNLLGTIAEKGAGFKSLRDGRADTTRARGRLGGLAELERELIRTRTGEGRERARARGVILGRSPKLTNHPRQEAIGCREAGEVFVVIF